MRRTVLRLDRENSHADVELPEWLIRCMTDDEVKLIRAEQEREDRLALTGVGGGALVEVEEDDDRVEEGFDDEKAKS